MTWRRWRIVWRIFAATVSRIQSCTCWRAASPVHGAFRARGPPSGRQTVREPGRARVDAREVERAGAQVLEGVRADDDEAR